MRRKVSNILFSIATVVALFLMMSGESKAVIYGTDDFQLTGKIEAKAAWFTTGAKGYSSHPYYPKTEEWKAWDLFKERNMAVFEVSHDLTKLTGLDLQYHIVARGIYDGVYDFGPSVFRDAYKANQEAFDRYNTKYSYGIWEAYFNYKTGPLNLRIGRQNLSWGNTDVMRVVDHINPIDNTWGGTLAESLDNRRIPLWMVRASVQPSNYFGLEGFLVPGSIDSTVAPLTAWGSPYGAPVPNLDIAFYGTYGSGISAGFNNSLGYLKEPSRDMESSRVGLKMVLPGLLGGQNSNVELSYQNTYWDYAGNRFSVSSPNPQMYITPGIVGIEQEYPKVHIAGLSWNYLFVDQDFIFKGDLSHVWGATVWINEINKPYIGALPMLLNGQYTRKDLTQFGLSFEKNIWMRFINSTERVGVSVEYYGTYTHDWDDRMVVPVNDPNEGGNCPQSKRYEQILAVVLTSNYHYKLKTTLAVLSDLNRGAYMLLPSVEYSFNNPLTLGVGYSCDLGHWSSNSMNDRDQVNVTAKYSF